MQDNYGDSDQARIDALAATDELQNQIKKALDVVVNDLLIYVMNEKKGSSKAVVYTRFGWALSALTTNALLLLPDIETMPNEVSHGFLSTFFASVSTAFHEGLDGKRKALFEEKKGE